jgi:ammonia channel protein AmtB
MVQSQKFSLQGWSFRTWVSKNKESLKLLVSGIAGLLSGLTSQAEPQTAILLAGIVGTVSKIALDTLDYWQSD